MSSVAMKCVGGKLDGEWWNVETRLARQGETIRLPKMSKMVDFKIDPSPAAITVQYEYYRVCVLRGPGHTQFKFLAYAKLSDWEAIDFQFRK